MDEKAHAQLVLGQVRRRGPLTRAQLAASTGLSRSTVHAVTVELLAAGRLVESARTSGQRGRPATTLAYNAAVGHVLAATLDDERVSVGIADLAGELGLVRFRALDTGADAGPVVAAVAGLAAEVLAAAGLTAADIRSCVVSLPGPVDERAGTVGAFSILRGWVGVHPAALLTEALGVPVTVDNDANAEAWAELAGGAAAGRRHVLYVKAATGVGAAVVADGRIYRGASGMAGELGHVTVEPLGRICRCGGRGCVETVAGIGAVIGGLAASHPGVHTFADALTLARDGDAAAERALSDAGSALGRAIGEVANVLNPEVVVVSGPLAAAGSLVLDPLRAALGQAAMRVIARDLVVVAGTAGPDAALVGSALLAAARVHGDPA